MLLSLKPCFRVTLWAALLGAAAMASAAGISPWFARTWQTEHGLPDNNVTGVAQSSDGYLWVGTHGGLARFDGVQFKKIALGLAGRRTDPLIRAMLMEENNRLWLAAEGGVVMDCSRGATNVFTTADGLPNFRPLSVAREQSGAVWVSYANGSACRIADGKVTLFTALDGLTGDGQCWLTADVFGQIWFAKAGQVSVFQDDAIVPLLTLSGGVLRLQPARGGGVWICAGLRLLKYVEGSAPVEMGRLIPDRVGIEPTVLFEDKQGAVWVGTTVGGLFRFDGTNMVHVETSHSEIRSIMEDREGSIWVGTGGGGLNRLRPRVLELQGLESGLPVESIRSVCEDTAGRIWATGQGGGLARYADGVWKTLSEQDGWPAARATCVVSDGQGGVWIGTIRGGLARWQDGQVMFLQRSDGLAGDIARSLLLDSKGNLWIGWESTNCLQRLRLGELTTYAQPANTRTIRALAEDAAGEIWAGTSDGFLFRVSGDSLVNETGRTVSPAKPIRCMYAPPDGGLWIGYGGGGGIGWLHGGKFAQVLKPRGLHDDGICAIAPDDRGSLWLASDHGVFEVRERELQRAAAGEIERVSSIVYGRDEALPNLQAGYGYAPGTLRSRDGRIWFPMRSGMGVVHPRRVLANRIPPSVLIERVQVDGRVENLSAETLLRLPPKHRKLEFDIAVLSFVAPENVRFKYRLDGVDEDWAEGGTQRVAVYPRLAAGRYQFRVIACNSAGVWNDRGVALDFVVDPFYWQTWWFRLAAVTGFTFGVVAVVRYVSFRRLRLKLHRLEQETALQRDRARIAQDLHDDLGASLTHIALLSELAQNDFERAPQARKHIDDIFRTARGVTRSLDEIVWAVSPKNDSLDRFVAHLSNYVPEYLRAAGMRARLDLPEELPAVVLPPQVRHHLYLAIKEVLHNSVKHAGASEVWLRLQVAPGAVTVTIEDNGQGFAAGGSAAAGADGLGNLRQRMSEIGGRHEQWSEPERGTRTTFTVPLNQPKA